MYTIITDHSRHAPKFNTTKRDITFKITPPDHVEDILETLHTVFTLLIEDLTAGTDDYHRVGITIQSPHPGYEIWLPLRHPKELTSEKILSEIEKAVQRGRDFRIDETLTAHFTTVKLPHEGHPSIIHPKLQKTRCETYP